MRRAFVEADHRLLRIGVLGREIMEIFHARKMGTVYPVDTQLIRLLRLRLVFPLVPARRLLSLKTAAVFPRPPPS